MIIVTRNRRGLPYSQKWFALEAEGTDFFSLVAYLQYLGDKPPSLFIRHSFTTHLVDLERDPETILAAMHRNVRYEIRRAESEGISWNAGVKRGDFVEFHAGFAKEKGIDGVDVNQLASYGDALSMTRVVRNDRVLAQHAYLVDPAERRVRFLYSSSGRFEETDSALVGRANRWCHWKDMLHFRGLGIRTYDLGGIADDSSDPALRGINEFKLKFGGRTVREDHWFSPPYALATRLVRRGNL